MYIKNLKAYTIENGAIGETDVFIVVLAINEVDALLKAKEEFKEQAKPNGSFGGYGEGYWNNLKIVSIVDVDNIPCVVGGIS